MLIDVQRLTPLVDYLASTLARLNEQVGNADRRASAEVQAASDEAKYQYQRAYLLTKDLRDQLYVYSNEQLKQLQAQSVIMYVIMLRFSLGHCLP